MLGGTAFLGGNQAGFPNGSKISGSGSDSGPAVPDMAGSSTEVISERRHKGVNKFSTVVGAVHEFPSGIGLSRKEFEISDRLLMSM